MALYGFNRPTARTLQSVAQSVKATSNKNASLAYPGIIGGGLSIGKKPLVRFTLGVALTTAQATNAATITDQFGLGVDGTTAITVHNLETHTGGAYVFAADSGDVGLAIWDSGTDYRIIQMECP